MDRRLFIKMSPAFPAAAVAATLTITEDGKPPIDLDVRVLKLQQGDTVVLSSPRLLRVEECHMIRRYWEDNHEGIKAMVLVDGMKVDGVLRG